jgi:hypothetical protein
VLKRAKKRAGPVDNLGITVEKPRRMGITCDSIPEKFRAFSPYMGGDQKSTGIFGLKGVSSSGVELNDV